MTGDRSLTGGELNLFGEAQFALIMIQEADDIPSLYDVAFLEVMGITDSHKKAIALMAERMINAGLMTREEFMACLE